MSILSMSQPPLNSHPRMHIFNILNIAVAKYLENEPDQEICLYCFNPRHFVVILSKPIHDTASIKVGLDRLFGDQVEILFTWRLGYNVIIHQEDEAKLEFIHTFIEAFIACHAISAMCETKPIVIRGSES